MPRRGNRMPRQGNSSQPTLRAREFVVSLFKPIIYVCAKSNPVTHEQAAAGYHYRVIESFKSDLRAMIEDLMRVVQARECTPEYMQNFKTQGCNYARQIFVHRFYLQALEFRFRFGLPINPPNLPVLE